MHGGGGGGGGGGLSNNLPLSAWLLHVHAANRVPTSQFQVYHQQMGSYPQKGTKRDNYNFPGKSIKFDA